MRVVLVAYIALYRACRPQQFQQIVGQNHVSQTLKNAVMLERVAHAYLFCGPRGTGKTSTAKVLAKAINCLARDAGEPCNKCELCLGVNNNSSYDILEIDGASNRGIDEIRDLKEKVKFAPTQARFKVYIIDEVHMLTTEAFNALLKTLEEPPRHVIFILATTEPHKVPLTILSRCQRFDFRRITNKIILNHLEEISSENNINIDKEALFLIARAAEGGMRDALSLLDQAITFGGDHITLDHVTMVIGTVKDQLLLEFADYIIARESSGVIQLINNLAEAGKDLGQFVWGLLEHFRNLLLFKSIENREWVTVAPDLLESLEQQAAKFSGEELFQIIETLAQLEKELKWGVNPKIQLEVTSVKLCKGLGGTSIDSLLNRIKQLEKQLAQGVFVKAESTISGLKKTGQKSGNLNSLTNTNTDLISKMEASKTNEQNIQDIQDIQVEPIGLTINDILDKWGNVLSLVKKKKVSAHAFLIEGKPVYLEGNMLMLGFEEGYAFHCEKIAQPENNKILEEALMKTFQIVLKVTCQMNNDHPKNNEDSFAKDVKKVTRLLGEDLIEIKE